MPYSINYYHKLSKLWIFIKFWCKHQFFSKCICVFFLYIKNKGHISWKQKYYYYIVNYCFLILFNIEICIAAASFCFNEGNAVSPSIIQIILIFANSDIKAMGRWIETPLHQLPLMNFIDNWVSCSVQFQNWAFCIQYMFLL